MNTDQLLFNSLTDPIPGIRGNIDIIPVKNNGSSYLYFHDMLGYAPNNFALKEEAGQLLSLFDGQRSVSDITEFFTNGATEEQFLEYVRFLDKNRILYSDFYRSYSVKVEEEFEQLPYRNPMSSGLSYPDDPEALRQQLDEAFSKVETVPVEGKVRGLYAPHIDPRVGMKSYARAFSTLRDLKPKRVVVIATSHYSGLYPDTYNNRPFILSSKDFHLPHGTVPADREAVARLAEGGEQAGISIQDRAHRVEHSIELHLLFLRYLWQHDFSIVPVLVGNFDELMYMQDGIRGEQVNRFSNLLEEVFGNDEETLFLVSGDLAHIGKKFGDQRPAREMFEEVKQFDKSFMHHAQQADPAGILEHIKQELDTYRICGFPPLYTFLRSFPGLRGQQLTYDLWDESERESAVTFGSVLYTE